MTKKIVVGIYVPKRDPLAVKVQEILTKYGCSIKTRLGLHETSTEFCATYGLLLLETFGDKTEIDKMIEELRIIDGGIQTKTMEFEL
jgi:hypothetical protein